MRITKSQLKYIIQEELSQVLREADKGPPEGMSSEAWEEVLRKERETMEFPPKPVQVDVSGEFDRPAYKHKDAGEAPALVVPEKRPWQADFRGRSSELDKALEFANSKTDWTDSQKHAFVNIQSGGDQEAILAALKARTYQQDYMNN